MARHLTLRSTFPPGTVSSGNAARLLAGAALSFVAGTAGCANCAAGLASGYARIYSKADALFDENRYVELESLVSAALSERSDDPQLLWRQARALHKLAEAEAEPRAKERLVRHGLAHARRAVLVQPDCGPAHKWCGILLSAASAFEGTRAQIESSFAVAEHFELAVALTPADATSRHLLGVWCFEVAKLSWSERHLAAAFFATPPQATYEQAKGHFLAAEEMEPGFYPKNLLMLARCCDCMGDKEEARVWRQKCLASQIKTPEDKITIAEAAALKI